MPGTNDSKLAKKFGIDVRGLETLKRRSKKKGTEKFNVCVPKDEMAHIQELWKNYEAVLKKNRHRKVVDKLRNVTNLGKKSFNESDGSRIASLVDIFRKTDNYITTAEKFFRDCKGHKQIKIYADKIKKDYDTLDKKGYLADYNQNDEKTNEQFDKNRFMVFSGNNLEKPKLVGKEENLYENNYASHVTSAYVTLYDEIDKILTQENNFAKYLKNAKNAVKDTWDRSIEKKLKQIHECVSKMKECDRALDDISQHIKENKSEEWAKEKISSLKEHIRRTLINVESIDKLSNTKYLEAIFYDKNQLAAAKNITTALTECTKNLDNFGFGIQSGLYKPKDLKKTYRDAVEAFERLSKTNMVAAKESTGAENSMDKRVEKVLEVYESLSNNLRKLFREMEGYDKKQNEFLDTYRKWKKEKKDAKRRAILYTLFSVLGILSAGAVKLSPLAEAFADSVDAPIDPMPS